MAGPNVRVRQKKQAMKPSSAPSVETVVVDVIEEPIPGVITVTEFEETDIRDVSQSAPGSHRPKTALDFPLGSTSSSIDGCLPGLAVADAAKEMVGRLSS